MVSRELSTPTGSVTSGWLPISSAPKVGRRILALVDNEVRFVSWTKTSHVPIYGFCLLDQGPEDCDLCEPTHWMPLPAPPSTPEGE